MSNNLGRIRTKRKTGSERVTSEGTDLGFDWLGFWQWSNSDLVSNASGGVLAESAEYMVARAPGIDTDGVGDEWAAHDLKTSSGVKGLMDIPDAMNEKLEQVDEKRVAATLRRHRPIDSTVFVAI